MIFGTHYEYPFGGMATRPEWLPRGEQDWRRDLAMIKDTGFDAIRIRIGFDSAIDEVGRLLDLCAELEVGVLFGFATFYVGYAFFEQHPDAKVVDRGGAAYPEGPHHYLWPRACVDHPVYRRRRDELVRAAARRFRGHDAIVDWDIHNEPNLGVGDHPCYCVHSVAGYRADLERRFGSIEAVNARFDAAFAGFADLQPPRAADPDPAGLWRDWREFSARRLSAFLLEGAAIIRTECPGVRVSFNYTHFEGLQAKGQDWWLLPRLDYTSSSLYHGSGAQTAAISGGHLALLKALAPEQELWITEFQGGPFPYAGAGRDAGASILWRGIQIEAEVNQVASHGADALFFYRWEPLLSGPEPWINHMVDADEYDTERRLATKRVIAELRGDAELLAGARTVPARVAIYLSRETVWQANARGAPLADTVYGLYGLFLDLGYEVTFVTGGRFPAAGEGLELLAVPFPLGLSADELEGMTAYVAGGGRVVVGAADDRPRGLPAGGGIVRHGVPGVDPARPLDGRLELERRARRIRRVRLLRPRARRAGSRAPRWRATATWTRPAWLPPGRRAASWWPPSRWAAPTCGRCTAACAACWRAGCRPPCRPTSSCPARCRRNTARWSRHGCWRARPAACCS